jgi:hypothetical protein
MLTRSILDYSWGSLVINFVDDKDLFHFPIDFEHGYAYAAHYTTTAIDD